MNHQWRRPLFRAHRDVWAVHVDRGTVQLRGEAGKRQVNCNVSLAHAVGDFLSAQALPC